MSAPLPVSSSSAESAWTESQLHLQSLATAAADSSEPPTTVVLITSNLQNDFFTRFPKRQETMNRYWVGRKESERVLGVDPQRGPLAQLMSWIRGYAADMPLAAMVPNFQDELPMNADGDDVGGDADDADPLLEVDAPIDDIDIDLMEEEAVGESTSSNAAATTTRNSHTTAMHSPADSAPFMVSLQSLDSAACVASPAMAGVHPLVSPNVTISPSPAPSSMPSTPSPTMHVSHSRLSLPLHHRPPPQDRSDGLPPAHSVSHVSMSSIASATSIASSAASSAMASPAHHDESDRPSIYVIHLRTCIDRSKSSAATAVERFGEYCISGTDGVRLCNRMDEDIQQFPNECIISTNRTLSSSTYRALKKKLQQIRTFVHKRHHHRVRASMAAAGTSPTSAASSHSASTSSRPALKLAVIGGWTDEDVYHICYELRTRLLASSIATCSQLTASPSPSQHWNYLSQLKRVMNVTVTRTIRELIGWFGVGVLPYRLAGVPHVSRRLWPDMQWNGDRPHSFHTEVDGEIMAHLYRNSSRIVIDTLVGGFSPSIVLSVNSIDHSGVREAPTVVKLASREDTATEYQAFQRIEEMLGNNAPSIRAYVELGDRAAVKFRYTRMSGGTVRTLKDLFDQLTDGEGPAPIYAMIDEIYGDIFGGWYAAACIERDTRVRKAGAFVAGTFVPSAPGTCIPACEVKQNDALFDEFNSPVRVIAPPVADLPADYLYTIDQLPGISYSVTRDHRLWLEWCRHPAVADTIDDATGQRTLIMTYTSSKTFAPEVISCRIDGAGGTARADLDEHEITPSFAHADDAYAYLSDMLSKTPCLSPGDRFKITAEALHQAGSSFLECVSGVIADSTDADSCANNSAEWSFPVDDLHVCRRSRRFTRKGRITAVTLGTIRQRFIGITVNSPQHLYQLADGTVTGNSGQQFDLYSYYFDGWLMSHGPPVSMVHQDPRYLKQFISYLLAKSGSEPAMHFKKDTDFYAYPPYERDTFQFPHCAPMTNLGRLFENPNGMPYLRTLPPRRLYSTFAHGDANLQNFLLDTRGNIWVIDFFFTEPRNHVLRDMAKTWSCVMYIAMEITSDRQFAQACLISEELAAARDLHAPLPTQIVGLTDAHLRAIYSILQRLWGHVGRIVKDRSYAVQFQLALVAEAMRHFLYATKNIYSKRWALVTAVLLSESALVQEKRIHDVTPSWLPLDAVPMSRGSLGMTRLPGNRNLMRFERRNEQTPFVPPNVDTNSTPSSPMSTPPPPNAASPTKETHKETTREPFRREMTQEERTLKEHRERAAVVAQQAASHGLEGSAERVAWQTRIAEEFARVLESQDRERADREKVLLAMRPRRQRSTQLPWHEHLSGGHSMLEDDDDETEVDADADADADGDPDHTASKRVSFDTTDPATKPTTSGRARSRHRERGPMARSNSGSLASFFERGGELRPDDGIHMLPPTLAATIVQSISHPALRSHLSSLPISPLESPIGSSAAPPASPRRMSRLQKECLRLKQEGVTHLLLLLTDAEFKEMGVDKAKLHQFMSEYAIQVVTVSMPPGIMQVPLLMDLVKFSLGILCDERKFKLVLVSKGGFHRAGTVAACILCAFGLPPEQAIRTVRECRGSQAIGRDSREKNVHKFDLQWKNLLISHILQTGQLTQQPEEHHEATEAERTRARHTHTGTHGQSYTFV